MSLLRAKKFLQLFAVAHILGGVLLPFLVASPLFAVYNKLLHQALALDATNGEAVNFMTGLFGPTIASWGVLFLYAVGAAFKNPDKKGWLALFACCLIWAPYDSLLSIQKGIYINAWIDLISASMILIPLFLVRKRFFAPNE